MVPLKSLERTYSEELVSDKVLTRLYPRARRSQLARTGHSHAKSHVRSLSWSSWPSVARQFTPRKSGQPLQNGSDKPSTKHLVSGEKASVNRRLRAFISLIAF